MYTLGNVRLLGATTQGKTGRRPAIGKRGISPVIATIILIAITIVIAIAVAGWVFGLFGSYSRTQPVTIVASASSCSQSQNQCVLVLSNQGGSAVTVVSASINGQPVSANSIAGATVISAGATSAAVTITQTGLVAGQTVQVQLGLSNGATLSTTLVVSS